jgi:hypothetical protein
MHDTAVVIDDYHVPHEEAMIPHMLSELHANEGKNVTLYIGRRQQRWLCKLQNIRCYSLSSESEVTHTDLGTSSASLKQLQQLRHLLTTCNKTGAPTVQAVCFSSEVDIKGDIVRFVKRFLGVATAFSGDGKNDVHALRAADVSMALPTGPGPSGDESTNLDNGVHDPEVAAAAPIRVSYTFWREYTQPALHSFAASLWSQATIVVFLLVLKQSGTAGINIGAASATGFQNNGDPMYPLLYQVLHITCFGIIIAAGGMLLKRNAYQDAVNAGPKLEGYTIALCSLVSYISMIGVYYASSSLCGVVMGQDNDVCMVTQVRSSIAMVILVVLDIFFALYLTYM